MTNSKQAINQKIALERNKKIWLIKDYTGKIIERCRSKAYADLKLIKLNKESFDEHTLERDNQYRIKLKEALNEKESKV